MLAGRCSASRLPRRTQPTLVELERAALGQVRTSSMMKNGLPLVPASSVAASWSSTPPSARRDPAELDHVLAASPARLTRTRRAHDGGRRAARAADGRPRVRRRGRSSDQHRPLARGGQDPSEQRQRRHVRPVQILEHQQHRPRLAHLGQESLDRTKQHVSLGLAGGSSGAGPRPARADSSGTSRAIDSPYSAMWRSSSSAERRRRGARGPRQTAGKGGPARRHNAHRARARHRRARHEPAR